MNMALHEQCVGATDEWYTPPHVFDALGCRFDMDVATTNPPVPWVPTSRHLWQSSLEIPWEGFIWMNPPFGARNGLVPWLNKFFVHDNGIALVPDRTSAPWWQQFARKVKSLTAMGRMSAYVLVGLPFFMAGIVTLMNAKST